MKARRKSGDLPVTNLQRFTRALNREPVDRILTWDLMDKEAVLTRFGQSDRSDSKFCTFGKTLSRRSRPARKR